MHEIFISYRRDDSDFATAKIHEALAQYYGDDRVFRDCNSMTLAGDYPKELLRAAGRCEVMLAVIGPGWLAADDTGERSIDRDRDWVRTELADALRRDVPVLPVLLGDTPPPAADQLPDELRPLAHRQAVRVRHEFLTRDVGDLVARLGELLPRNCTPLRREPVDATPATEHGEPPVAAGVVFHGRPSIGQFVTGDAHGTTITMPSDHDRPS